MSLVRVSGPTGGVAQASSVPPLPVQPVKSFQNFEENNGTPERAGNYFWDAWFTSPEYTNSPVYEGRRAVLAHASAARDGTPPQDHGGSLGINPSSPETVDLSCATTISIWVYDKVGNNTVQLRLRDGNEDFSSKDKGWSTKASEKNTWTQIAWNLADFQGVDMTRIKNIEVYEWNDGDYYFDDVTYQ
jgi:hypothetical protein